MSNGVYRPSKRVELIAVLALLGVLLATWHSWGPIERIYQQTHNTLGQINGQVPTSELFFWTSAALILYFGTRGWASIVQKVFALNEERTGVWQRRLQWARLAAMTGLLMLTLLSIHRSGYNLW